VACQSESLFAYFYENQFKDHFFDDVIRAIMGMKYPRHFWNRRHWKKVASWWRNMQLLSI